jgi:CIC family chloride channel protein
MKLFIIKLRRALHPKQRIIDFNKISLKTIQRFIDADKKNFGLIFFAFLIGLIAGLIGTIFRLTLDYLNTLRNILYAHNAHAGFVSYLLLVSLTVIGTLVAILLVKKVAPETSGSGVHEIEGALDGSRPLRWKRVIPIKFIGSLFSLGSGLLLGREGPTIQLGANVGKMIKDSLHLQDKVMNPLVSAGAAAGLASAFNAPLSGIIFVIEELHGHFRYTFFSVASIMVASSTADFVVRILIGVDPVIRMTVFQHPAPSAIWMFILLGIFFSFVGYLFNNFLVRSLDFVRNLNKRMLILYAIMVGIVIAIVGILNSNIIGGGYQTIRFVLDHSLTFSFLLILFVSRLVLTIMSYSTGVPGGIFAPLLALGVVFGMLFGNVMQYLFPALMITPGIFAVAGMAGIFASTVRAPLTGLVLAVEMTANFGLILPLLVTSITASVVTTAIGNKPIYTTLLKRTLENTKTPQ